MNASAWRRRSRRLVLKVFLVGALCGAFSAGDVAAQTAMPSAVPLSDDMLARFSVQMPSRARPEPAPADAPIAPMAAPTEAAEPTPEPAPTPATAAPAPAPVRIEAVYIQLAAVGDPAYVDETRRRLESDGRRILPELVITVRPPERGTRWHRFLGGPYADRDQAEGACRALGPVSADCFVPSDL
jgi:cell division septation protein DedD